MTAFGIDEAWSRLSPQEMRAAGKTFVVGYVSEDAAKNLTPAEVAAYHGADLAVLLVYEYSTHAAESGAAGGKRNAQLAVPLAEKLGYPRGCAIAFAVDEGSPDLASLGAYAQAFTAVCHAAGYRSMVYGGIATVRYCLDHHLVDLGWQAYAWSGGQWDPRAVIRQVRNGVTLFGHDIDFDTAMVDDFGAWMPGAPTQGDTFVSLSPQAEHDLIFTVLDILLGTDPSQRGDKAPNNLHRKLDALVAAAAADKARDDAMNAAIQALAQALTKGGTSLDTAAVLAAIAAAGDKESTTVAALQQQISDLQGKLAAALGAAGKSLA